MHVPTITTTPFFEGLLTVGKLLGMSRSVATVFALLYSTDGAISVEAIGAETRLSRSAVSLAMRDLLQLGLAQEVGMLGERCRYYAGQPDLSQAVKQMVFARLEPTFSELRAKLSDPSAPTERLQQAHRLLHTLQLALQVIQAKKDH
ncbi:MAG: hypothetical protein HC915_03580 [Anaerolineae bacterium]|nr:hypothetical protein [Anaerolineae bacterium]